MGLVSPVTRGFPAAIPYAVPIGGLAPRGSRYQFARAANGLPASQQQLPGPHSGGYGPLLHDIDRHHKQLVTNLVPLTPPRPPQRRKPRNSSAAAQENRPPALIEEIDAEDSRQVPRSQRIPDGLDDLSALALAKFDQIRQVLSSHEGGPAVPAAGAGAAGNQLGQWAAEAHAAAAMMLEIIDSAAEGDHSDARQWRSQAERIQAKAQQLQELYGAHGGTPGATRPDVRAASAPAAGTHRREAAAIIREMRMALRQLPAPAGPPSAAWANVLDKAGRKLQHLAREVGQQNPLVRSPSNDGPRSQSAMRLAAEGSGHASALLKASQAQAARVRAASQSEIGYRASGNAAIDPEFWRHAHSVMSSSRLDLGPIIESLERLSARTEQMASAWFVQWPQTRFAYSDWRRGHEVRL